MQPQPHPSIPGEPLGKPPRQKQSQANYVQAETHPELPGAFIVP